MLYMHVTYRYHCEEPLTLYYNHRHALFIIVIMAEYYKKYTPKSAA